MPKKNASAHPQHCIKGIPYGKFLRILRICSTKADIIKHCVTKGQRFVRPAYPITLICKAFLKALRHDRQTLLNPIQKEPDETAPNIPVTTYNPGFRGLKNVASKSWDLLGKSCTTRAIFRENFLSAFRRPKNLKDYLMKSKLEPQREDNDVESSNKCLPPNTCRFCPKLNTDGRILSSASGRTYMSRYNVCCSSSNLIYCLTCKRCGIQYVGQTKRELKVRFSVHFLKITKNNPESEIARHFNPGHHKGLDTPATYECPYGPKCNGPTKVLNIPS